MKLATFHAGGADRIAIVHGGDTKLFDLAAAAKAEGIDPPQFRSMLDLIDSGEGGLYSASRLFERLGDEPTFSHALTDIKLRSPVPVPRQLRGFTSFPGHLAGAPAGVRRLGARLRGEPLPEMGKNAIPQVNLDRPIYFKTNRYSVVGTDEVIRWPRFSEYMDVELECGFFLSKSGVDIPVSKADDYIFGYSVFGDYSARDEQVREMAGHLGPAKGKDFDTGNAIGPWIVTKDELPDIMTRRMTAVINGKIWADSDMSDGVFSFAEMISFVSNEETLFAGEFISAGTVTGGSGLERDIYLSDGDDISLTIDGVGTLHNLLSKVHRESTWLDFARPRTELQDQSPV